MPKDDMKLLPTEVKLLVNDGTYSLYEVRNRPGVAYVLLTNTQDVYALSATGEVLQNVQIRRLSDVQIGAPAFFAGLEPRASLRLNYA